MSGTGGLICTLAVAFAFPVPSEDHERPQRRGINCGATCDTWTGSMVEDGSLAANKISVLVNVSERRVVAALTSFHLQASRGK